MVAFRPVVRYKICSISFYLIFFRSIIGTNRNTPIINKLRSRASFAGAAAASPPKSSILFGAPTEATPQKKIGRAVESGLVEDVERAVRELAGENLHVADGLVIYCPGCSAAIARLQERVASRLRRATLDGIQDLLGRAYDSRKERRQVS